MWGRWKMRACAEISRARAGSARARLLARAPGAESAAVGGAGARLRGSRGRGRGLGRGLAAGGGWRRGVSELRGRGRAQQLLPEHFLTQQSPCAGRAAPRRL